MKVIGLTGGIAAGKSQVSSILKDLGAVIIDADLIARNIIKKGLPAWKKIKDGFGEEYLLPSGEIDRKKLGELVFSNEVALKELNAITHPAIKEIIETRINELKDRGYNGAAVIDAALLLEEGWESMVDEVWVVDSPIEQRIKRLMVRDHLLEEQALIRINTQMSQEERNSKAHWIILNSSDIDDLRKQVELIWSVSIRKN